MQIFTRVNPIDGGIATAPPPSVSSDHTFQVTSFALLGQHLELGQPGLPGPDVNSS